MRAHSTNVTNLDGRRLHTLLTSALLMERRPTIREAAVLAGLLAGAELYWGSRRSAGLFVLGHVGTTALVYAGLKARGVEDPDAVDVGVSYGTYCLLGATAANAPGRVVSVPLLVGAQGVRPLLGEDPDFTDVGHLVALLLGVGAGFRCGRRRSPRSHAPSVA
jgi:hypothetical protein